MIPRALRRTGRPTSSSPFQSSLARRLFCATLHPVLPVPFFVRENVPLHLGLSFPSLRALFLNDVLERIRLNAAHYAPGEVRCGIALMPFLLNSNLKLHSLGTALPSTVGGVKVHWCAASNA